ncbi:MAG: hypothetical protein MJB14_13510 [Spirochaetes bacterium]|nr:hypothetical protein [Spirochaetota bacterium]
MKENWKIIKYTYLIGAFIDGFWAVALLFPGLFKIVVNNPDLIISKNIYILFIIAASLMLGWTFLLLWGYRQPIARRFVLLLTTFPVVFGIFIGTIISLSGGRPYTLIFVIKTFLIMSLMIFSYIKAEKVAKREH